MARTTEEIQQEIIDAKENEASLNGLTTTSKVSIWLGLVRIITLAFRTLELLWDAKKEELDEAAAAAVAGTPKWYADRILEFQYGHSLVLVDGKPVYLEDDPDARIVKYVAVNPIGGVVEIKVAKDDSGDLVPLTATELNALDSYIQAIKFAGTVHNSYSLAADIVRLEATAYYDGKLDPTDFDTATIDGLKAHLKGIYFDGKLNINKLRDAAEAVPGMIDFQITLLQAKADGASSFTTVTYEYGPLSGYHVFDAGYPDITYVAK